MLILRSRSITLPSKVLDENYEISTILRKYQLLFTNGIFMCPFKMKMSVKCNDIWTVISYKRHLNAGVINAF